MFTPNVMECKLLLGETLDPGGHIYPYRAYSHERAIVEDRQISETCSVADSRSREWTGCPKPSGGWRAVPPL